MGTEPCIEVPQGVARTLYVVATLDGALSSGVKGAEFRIEIVDPSGWYLMYTPPEGALYVGNPVDSDGLDCEGAGVTLAFSACRRPHPETNTVQLGRLQVTSIGGAPTHLLIKRHISPGNRTYRCPLLIECNEPRNEKHCVEPWLRTACDGDEALQSGPPIQDDVYFVTALDQPLNPAAFAAPERYPDRELLLTTPVPLQLPETGTVALEEAGIPSAVLLEAFEDAHVAEMGRAFPECETPDCMSEGDQAWCASVSRVALLRFNHPRTATRALRTLNGLAEVTAAVPAGLFLVRHETQFDLQTDASEGMRIEKDVPLLVSLTKPAHVHIELLDGSGRTVANVLEGFVAAGEHRVGWSALPVEVPRGLFTLRVRAGVLEETYKVVMASE